MTKLNPTKTLELIGAATQGVWVKVVSARLRHKYTIETAHPIECSLATDVSEANARFICHAHEEIKHYASWVQRALPELNLLQKMLRQLEGEHDNAMDNAALIIRVSDIERLIEEVEE